MLRCPRSGDRVTRVGLKNTFPDQMSAKGFYRGYLSCHGGACEPFSKQLAEEGRAPLVALGGGTRWYDTQNVRFLTIDDLDEFCRDEGIQIHQRVSLDTEANCHVEDNPNLNADLAIVVLSR